MRRRNPFTKNEAKMMPITTSMKKMKYRCIAQTYTWHARMVLNQTVALVS